MMVLMHGDDDALTGPHGTGSDVAHFSGLDEIMEGFHCLFGGNGGVESL